MVYSSFVGDSCLERNSAWYGIAECLERPFRPQVLMVSPQLAVPQIFHELNK